MTFDFFGVGEEVENFGILTPLGTLAKLLFVVLLLIIFSLTFSVKLCTELFIALSNFFGRINGVVVDSVTKGKTNEARLLFTVDCPIILLSGAVAKLTKEELVVVVDDDVGFVVVCFVDEGF